MKAKDWFKKFYEKNKKDIGAVLDFLVYVSIFGILVNFSLFSIFKINFTFYSWIGWGIAVWFIEFFFVKIIRRVIYRR